MIKSIRPIQTAEIKIAPAIAIHIASGNTGTVEINLIGRIARPAEQVCEINPGALGTHQNKACLLARNRGKHRASIGSIRTPVEPLRGWCSLQRSYCE